MYFFFICLEVSGDLNFSCLIQLFFWQCLLSALDKKLFLAGWISCIFLLFLPFLPFFFFSLICFIYFHAFCLQLPAYFCFSLSFVSALCLPSVFTLPLGLFCSMLCSISLSYLIFFLVSSCCTMFCSLRLSCALPPTYLGRRQSNPWVRLAPYFTLQYAGRLAQHR